MLRLPLLRAGRPYESLETYALTGVASGEAVAEVSLANPGLIARDLARAGEHRRRLEEVPIAELLAVCRRAAGLFAEAELPLDTSGAVLQGPEDYLRQLAATTGMPIALGRANMAKIRHVLEHMEEVLAGLTRGLPLEVLDRGWGEEGGRPVSYRRRTDALGAVLPANSPGVHALWLPAVALKVPLVLKPGRREPWTPTRVARALLVAGCPPEAVSVYPTSVAGAGEILLACGRSLLFGDVSTVGAWAEDPRIELHGPGWSKVILGPDAAEHWEEHLELLAESVAANGGRSCVNASGVWTAARGRELAEALARRLEEIEPRPLDHPGAALAAFAEPEQARRVSEVLDGLLAVPGAEDLSARLRGGGRLVERHGLTFLLPTVVWCESPDHPLAQTELLLPFAAVVEVGAGEIFSRLGPTLAATVLGRDEEFLRRAMDCAAIERLNLGPVPTCRVSWDQPHEGNLFEHLYRRRAFERRDPPPAGERAA